MSRNESAAASTLRRYIETAFPTDTDEAHQALDALLDEIDRLREQVNSGRTGRERAEGLPEGTLPRV